MTPCYLHLVNVFDAQEFIPLDFAVLNKINFLLKSQPSQSPALHIHQCNHHACTNKKSFSQVPSMHSLDFFNCSCSVHLNQIKWKYDVQLGDCLQGLMVYHVNSGYSATNYTYIKSDLLTQGNKSQLLQQNQTLTLPRPILT